VAVFSTILLRVRGLNLWDAMPCLPLLGLFSTLKMEAIYSSETYLCVVLQRPECLCYADSGVGMTGDLERIWEEAAVVKYRYYLDTPL
jgi:hypothetical protein